MSHKMSDGQEVPLTAGMVRAMAFVNPTVGMLLRVAHPEIFERVDEMDLNQTSGSDQVQSSGKEGENNFSTGS